MSQKRIGVLRGGPSNEYEISLATGANVLSALREKFVGKYQPRDILIDRAGKWHMDGMAGTPAEILNNLDVAFLALHGTYGEDGKVQGILEIHGVPFTGSGSLASAVGMNKILSKEVFASNGIKTPLAMKVSSKTILKDPEKVAHDLFRTCSMPAVVKPVSAGSSVGISIARTNAELKKGLVEAATHGDTVLVEEFIPGVEATVGIIEGFRGEELYALPPVEIRPMSEFFDYSAKYEGKSKEIVPGNFTEQTKKELVELSRKIHRALGLRHYSRSDFIIHPRRGIYALEVNTLPGLTNESLIPKALRAVGSDTHELIDHLLTGL